MGADEGHPGEFRDTRQIEVAFMEPEYSHCQMSFCQDEEKEGEGEEEDLELHEEIKELGLCVPVLQPLHSAGLSIEPEERKII